MSCNRCDSNADYQTAIESQWDQTRLDGAGGAPAIQSGGDQMALERHGRSHYAGRLQRSLVAADSSLPR